MAEQIEVRIITPARVVYSRPVDCISLQAKILAVVLLENTLLLLLKLLALRLLLQNPSQEFSLEILLILD